MAELKKKKSLKEVSLASLIAEKITLRKLIKKNKNTHLKIKNRKKRGGIF